MDEVPLQGVKGGGLFLMSEVPLQGVKLESRVLAAMSGRIMGNISAYSAPLAATVRAIRGSVFQI